MYNTWRDLLFEEMAGHRDPGPVIKYAPHEMAFHTVFDTGYGNPKGPHVLAWTDMRVYFPMSYHGLESIGSAPRNPCDDGQEHVGGL